jgi:tRNA dimethylallyltransferase
MYNNKYSILPLVVIVGPTASGKTNLAIDIAKICDGEIICADSRTIYKDMDIGTAKPTIKDRSLVQHWGINLADPGDYFSVADFKKYALKKIEEIRSRGHIPFLVGGTGLYIDSVIFNYNFGRRADITERDKLNKMTLTELYDYCNKNNITIPENDKNKRYIIRAIEKDGDKVSKLSCPVDNTIIVGILTNRDTLRTRISDRIEQLFDDGVVNEARVLGKKYGWDNEAMKGNIYPLVHSYLLGDISWKELRLKSSTLDWRLAKRQLTWLKRNQFIKWFVIDDAKSCILNQLNS